jgi:hypothetical protein
MTLRRGVAISLLLASAWAAAPGRRSLVIRRARSGTIPLHTPMERQCLVGISTASMA